MNLRESVLQSVNNFKSVINQNQRLVLQLLELTQK